MGNAATGQCAEFEQEWLIEAITELGPYVRSFTTKFMRKHDLPVANSKSAMLNRIQNEIIGPKERLHFEDLVEYLDELRLWGRQCVVLYALKNVGKKNDGEKYLEKLRSPEYIKERLGRQKNRFNNNVCRWKANKPFLSEVRHNFDKKNKRGELSFKWVQTRQFEKLIKRTYQTFDERSVNFFIINLEDGSAQLRIQSLPDRSLTTLGEELQTYTKEIEKLLDFDHFTPVSLKPVMQEFLFKKVLPITHWSVRTRTGRLQGNRDPSFIQRRFRLPLQGITPQEVRVYWECQQEVTKRKRLFFALEAEDNVNDVIIFNAITDKEGVDYIVSTLLEAGRKYLKLKKIAPPPPLPKIPKDGLLDVIEQKAKGTPHERLKKAATEAAILPGLALNRIIFESITSWLPEPIIERITHVPFIVFELLVYGILLFVFYGGNRVQNLFLRIPLKYVNIVFRLFLGQSYDIEFSDRVFKKQHAAATA